MANTEKLRRRTQFMNQATTTQATKKETTKPVARTRAMKENPPSHPPFAKPPI